MIVWWAFNRLALVSLFCFVLIVVKVWVWGKECCEHLNTLTNLVRDIAASWQRFNQERRSCNEIILHLQDQNPSISSLLLFLVVYKKPWEYKWMLLIFLRLYKYEEAENLACFRNL